jgi:RNase adaptor protein for sRNA GlmZ degradation
MGDDEQLKVVLFSFGFKYGTPVDINMVLDVRFLPNPYWVESLRSKTGKEEDVAAYVLKSNGGEAFMEYLKPMLQFLIDQNTVAEKKTVRIGIGCTGGHHRSVAVVEAIYSFLAERQVHSIVFHRDIEKDSIKVD